MVNRSYTKSRLLKELAWKVGVKQALSQKILDALAEIIYREAAIGGFVLPGVCKFDVVDKKERRMRNPRTGEALVVPPHKALRVTLSNSARNAVAPKPKAVPLSQYVPPAPVAAAAPVVPGPAPAVPAPEPAPAAEEPKTADVAPVAAAVPAPEPAPAAEEPKAEEPKVDEPKVDEPKADEPKADEPKVEEPKVEEPKAAEAAPAPVAEPAPAPAAEPAPAPAPAEEGAPVSFRCPGCGQEIEAPAEAIGCEAECPMCGRILVVPQTSEPGTMYGPATGAEQPKTEESVVTAKEAEDMDPQQLKNRTIRIDTTLFGFDDDDDDDEAKKPATPPIGEEKMISFFCKNCHQEIEATADMAGSQCECPNCGATFEVPYFSDSGSIHDDSAAKREEQRKIEAQKHSTMRINLDDF